MEITLAVDANGMRLNEVGLESSARMALNFTSADLVSEQDLTNFPPLPAGFLDMGLFTEDGGYAPEWEVGEKTNLYQKGYSVSAGEKSQTFTVTFAETTSANVLKLTGYDNTDHVTRDPISTPLGCVLAIRYANHKTLLMAGSVVVVEVSANMGTAGEVASYSVKFAWEYNSTICGYHRTLLINDSSGC